MEAGLAAIILLGLYFTPFIIALLRSHQSTASIFVINLFLGWTLIGWVVALAMAVGNQNQPTVIVNTGPASVYAPPAGSVTTRAPASPGPAKHSIDNHDWVDHETRHETSGVVVQTRRCTSCGIIEVKPPAPHEHRWGDPLTSQKYNDRLYQECAECKEARYIN